ncbi:MAG TPA: hypothetical protein VFB34_12440 [Chloroflexota bacterium]|nr:hypothetical protein [Chloroflexota bacterium]
MRGGDIYYKVRDVVRRRGHAESDSCRVFKDWHIELRVGSGHVSVWTSEGIVFLTMSEIPVHHTPGSWEDHLDRLHAGRPTSTHPVDLRQLLRAQLMEEERLETEGVEVEQLDGGYDAPAETGPGVESVENGAVEHPAAEPTA